MLPTITQAANDIRSGRLSPVDLLDRCLAQIDRSEERVRAWVLVDRERARADAERLTVELRRGQWRGPLHGIPLGVKDIFDVADWPTAAGCRRWAHSIARQDATVVRRLREAGAVFIGKTVTTPFASFDPPPTRNPWKLDRTPGGSSSGSAAAVACGMCLGALASQTGGSITRPASYCGVVACKPTYGLVSVDGVVPLAASMDHVGAMARSVRDVAVLLQTIGDPASGELLSLVADLQDYDERDVLNRGPRLLRARGFFDEHADGEVRAMMDRVIRELEEKGVAAADTVLPSGFSEVLGRHRTVMAVEAAAFHQPFLERHPENYPPNIRALLEEGLVCPAPEYARCKDHQAQLTRDMETCVKYREILLTPATTCPAPDARTTGDPAFNSPWSYTGMPTVSLPAGWSQDGLPLAIQLVGNRWSERHLFVMAVWCEQALAMEPREPPVV